MKNFVLSTASQQEIQSLDNRIHETVETINQLKTNREFFLSFAKDPQQFINKWLISQMRDLKTMTDVVGNPEEECRSDFYFQPHKKLFAVICMEKFNKNELNWSMHWELEMHKCLSCVVYPLFLHKGRMMIILAGMFLEMYPWCICMIWYIMVHFLFFFLYILLKTK